MLSSSVYRPWVFPLVTGFALIAWPNALQVLAAGYSAHFILVSMPGLLDDAVSKASGHGTFSRLASKILRVAAWISAIGLAWLAVTIAINLVWPTPVAPDFFLAKGK